MAAGIIFALAAGVLWLCFTAPLVVTGLVIAGAVLVLLIFVLVLLGTALRNWLDVRADRRGVPIEGPARPRRTSRAYLLAVLSGGVTPEAVKRHDVRKVLRRRYGKRGAR